MSEYTMSEYTKDKQPKTDGKNICLITNNVSNYRVFLLDYKDEFIGFLESIYKELEIEDYDIYQINNVSTLETYNYDIICDIFGTKCLDFSLNKKDHPQEFLDNFMILIKSYEIYKDKRSYFNLNYSSESIPKHIESSKTTPLQQCEDSKTKEPIDVKKSFQINIGTRLNSNFDIRDDIPVSYDLIGDEDKSKKPEEILPYNENIESQDNPFQNNYYSHVDWKFEKTKSETHTCSIIYCVSLNTSLIILDSQFVSYLTQKFRDFKLVKIYENVSVKEIEDLKAYFHRREFESYDVIQVKINNFDALFDMGKNSKDDTLINIEYYLKERYQFDNDTKNIMKASAILETIISELALFTMDRLKLSKDVSAILLKLGLKKKRMADGIYYYGIVSKKMTKPQNTEEIFKKVLEEHKLSSVEENIKLIKT